MVLVLAILAVPVIAFAEVTPDPTPIDIQTWLLQTIQWVLSLKGASVLVIVVGAVQILMAFFKTALGDSFVGKYQLLTLAFLSVVGVVVGGLSTGLTFLQALFQGPSLAAIQVFIYQLIKQFTAKSVPAKV